MKKLFLDTEFTGLHQNTTLVSLALVADTGESFYAEFTDYDKKQVNKWLQRNVIDHLWFKEVPNNRWFGLVFKRSAVLPPIMKPVDMFAKEFAKKNVKRLECKGTKAFIKKNLLFFIAHAINTPVQIWADCLAYDWVLFCQLFGGAMKLPKQIHYMPMDVCQLIEQTGIDIDIKREDLIGHEGVYEIWREMLCHHHQSKHNALFDAYLTRSIYNKLK